MPAGSYRFQVGNIGCTVLSDGYFSYPTPWFFPNADPDTLSDLLTRRHLPVERVLSPYTCMLVETGREVILIDTGGGEYTKTTGAIRARLEMAGVRAANVTTVVLTHAHPDHIGGAVDFMARPAFPNARYVLSEREWEFWTTARTNVDGLRVPLETREQVASAGRRALGVLRHQIEPVDRETEIVPGVRLIPASGHTPGHLAVMLTSEGDRLLNLGDAAVHPIHLERPEWENGFDLSPAIAIATRRELMERAVSDNMHVMAFHFPFPSVGRIAGRSGDGWEWQPGW